MFNLFNKKKGENPVSDIFSNLSINQKMSIINLLLTIGVCDDEQGNQEKELQYLNTYIQILDISSDTSLAYLKSYGHERIIEDLKILSKSQKELLVVVAWGMIICDGRSNETELQVTNAIFEKLGVSEDQFFSIIEKTQALMKHVSEK